MAPTPLQPSDTARLTRSASYPFNKPNADMVLRSCDRVDFRVYSQILVAASPIFESMLEVPQPPPEAQNTTHGLPVVDVSEESAVLDYLLRLCYPVNEPTAKKEPRALEATYRAAMKYEMELVPTLLKKELDLCTAFDSAFKMWATSCRLRLERFASEAALRLGWALEYKGFQVFSMPIFSGLVKEPISADMLERVTASQLHRLYEYLLLQHQEPASHIDRPSFINPPTIRTADPHRANSPPAEGIVDLSKMPIFDEVIPAESDVICLSRDGTAFPAHQSILRGMSTRLCMKVDRLAPAGLSQREERDLDGSLRDHAHAEGEAALPTLTFDEKRACPLSPITF
ncbi:hypothetical protein C8Q77DRAFT_320261 [Trametes polyzona]|nr:hypothetical protein C8Q77DRAFT_320261 [Trametes polyzona]